MKLQDKEITEKEINEFLLLRSDFGFEVSVLRILNDLGFSCQHSGTYEDPVSKKSREFDIRAKRITDQTAPVILRLAVECKNLRPNYPLVVHCLPRSENEAFMDVVYSSSEGREYPSRPPGYRLRLRGQDSFYCQNELVGKSSDQIGRRPNGELASEDREVFDKISQALHSACELLESAHVAGYREKAPTFSVVLPMLVLPADRLWVVSYDTSGKIVSGPKRQKHVQYFASKDWSVLQDLSQTWYTLSHIEICEIDYLKELVSGWQADDRISLSVLFEAYDQTFT